MRIERIIIKNFKKFKNLDIEFNDNFNVLIGDNETGKSSILEAIDLTLSGSVYKFENRGIEEVFNIDVINNYLNSAKEIEKLPFLSVELFFKNVEDHKYYGKNNSLMKNAYGIILTITKDDDFIDDIKESLMETKNHFPFEYYKVDFKTFGNFPFNAYNKLLKHVYVDNNSEGTEKSTLDFTKSIYKSLIDPTTKQVHLNKLNQMKSLYNTEVLKDFNKKHDYHFGLNKNIKYGLENNLMIFEEGVSLNNKGKGKQAIIKTEMAISKNKDENCLNVILLEEPENHLSFNNMLKLIESLKKDNQKQIFLTTHSDLILSRLDLSYAIFLKNEILKLNEISIETAKYFNKLPNSNLLQFMLSDKVILVEGPSEYILFDKFYFLINSKKTSEDGVSIISINSLSFKRYIEVSKKFKNKVAIITDNDGDYNNNVLLKYKDLINDSVNVFSDEANENNTFEVSLYNNNKDFFEDKKLFKSENILKSMLNNKTESALKLLNILENNDVEFEVPNYIKAAIKWIKE